MKKQIKTLVAAGLITIVSASGVITSFADSNNTCKVSKPKAQLVCINSNRKVYTFKSNCNINKPALPEDINDNNTVKPETKPDTNTGNSNNNNNTVKPDAKPEIDNSFSANQQQVLDLVNKERSKVGAKPLTLNKELSNVATTKSQDMINKNYFDHNSPTYGSPFDMMKKFGISYRTAGENIAMGQKSPTEVMNSWMNSDGHRKNILNPNYTELGVGIAKASNEQLYWTQMFIGK
ncbi:MAG: CAP domain-containing protein [Romboutsia sp.]|uniref:CAP domain-containing protein n=1 Tax=Romboutsia sp. TaxID=1965302 RepID=UPI003F38250A